jgi:hypothetical protein
MKFFTPNNAQFFYLKSLFLKNHLISGAYNKFKQFDRYHQYFNNSTSQIIELFLKMYLIRILNLCNPMIIVIIHTNIKCLIL